MAEFLLDRDEVLLTVERYPGRPEYRVVTHTRTFDAPSLDVVQRLVLQAAQRTPDDSADAKSSTQSSHP